MLISSQDVKELSRDMSIHVDSDRIDVYIRESEYIDIKPALGDELYLAVTKNTEKYTLLINGGEYSDKCGNKKVFAGLKTALAYYTYARLVKNNGGNLTRFGYVEKDSEYSAAVEYKRQIATYSEVFSIADSHLNECLDYLVAVDEPLYRGKGEIKSNRVKYRLIGD